MDGVTPITLAGGDDLQPAPKDLTAAVEEVWVSRRNTQHPGRQHTIACQKAEVEFFAGAMAAMQTLGYQPPTYWVICIMTGRRLPELNKAKK